MITLSLPHGQHILLHFLLQSELAATITRIWHGNTASPPLRSAQHHLARQVLSGAGGRCLACSSPNIPNLPYELSVPEIVSGAIGVLAAVAGLAAGLAAAADCMAVTALPLHAAHTCMSVMTTAQLRVSCSRGRLKGQCFVRCSTSMSVTQQDLAAGRGLRHAVQAMTELPLSFYVWLHHLHCRIY